MIFNFAETQICISNFFLQVFGLFGLIWFVLMLARFDIISLDPFENIANNSTKTNEQLTPLETPSHFSAHGKQGSCYFYFSIFP